ncbi:MAG: glycosyltransferase [Candidatus Brocadiales bacterium]|nr:glycosyltransferase [Candidatus Brocadiales bacterium]
MNTMAASRHIKYEVKSKDYATAMYGILHDNGLDMERVVTLLPRSNALMAKIYKNTDIGLFTNRCEGGTNLVLMEYMACGKPVIASYNSGHRDVINKDNSIMINDMRQIDINKNGTKIAVWDDPDLDETINHLEWAYQHRDELKSYGTQAGNDLKELTWKKSAERFVEIIEGSSQGTDIKKQYCAV